MLISGVQESFDRDVAAGEIGPRGWNLSSGASAMGRLGYKLMLQTGDVTNPVDMARVSELDISLPQITMRLEVLRAVSPVLRCFNVVGWAARRVSGP